MIPSILTGLSNSVENLYKLYLQGNTDSLNELLYSLAALSFMGSEDADRYTSILAAILKDVAPGVKEGFLAEYEVPGGLYKKLEQETTWPEIKEYTITYDNLTEEEVLELKRTKKLLEVNINRDKAIESGFSFGGNTYQSRQSDRENIMGASMAASMAISQGAQAGNYRWASPSSDFVWITADNQLVQMDAFNVLQLYQAGLQFKTTLTFVARSIKNALLEATTLEDLEAISCQVSLPL
jgi:hypothetical protein